MTDNNKPIVGVVMGSDSDWPIMKLQVLDKFNVSYEAKVVSAHRTPDSMYEYAETANSRGIKCIIAGADGATHLPGMLASKTEIPVLGSIHTKYKR